jgi:hypothetical protein
LGFAGDVVGDPLSYALPDLPLKDLERAAELAEELESIVGRMPPGSFTQDPGMRAGDEFTDVGSAGYREQAKRVAERGGAKEYATSVEEEEADAEADTMRNRVGTALAAMVGLGSAGALGAASRPLVNRGATGLTRHGDRYLDQMVQAGHTPSSGMLGSHPGPSGLNRATLDALRTSGRLPTPTLNPGFLQQQERLLGRGFQGRMNPMPPGSQPGMTDRIKAALGSKAGVAAIDTTAFGGMMSPMVYDLIQRHGRGARPFGPGR